MRRRWCLWAGAASLLLGLVSLSVGVSGAGPAALWSALRGDDSVAWVLQVLLTLRLPRTAAAWLCGGALALSGLLLQTALGNPLASPGILGVNAGAGFSTVLWAALLPAGGWLMSAGAAFLGAACAALLVLAMGSRAGGGRRTLVLAGVALGSLFSAGTDAVVTLAPDTLADRAGFAIGGFAAAYGSPVALLPIPVAVGTGAALLLAGRMNLLLLGDETAISLGLNVRRCRILCVLTSALLAASAVSVCGLLGFAGLLVPHGARLLLGSDCRRLVPFTFLGGGLLVLGCDVLGRALFAPYEVPAGILLSAVGAPFFLWLLLRRRAAV